MGQLAGMLLITAQLGTHQKGGGAWGLFAVDLVVLGASASTHSKVSDAYVVWERTFRNMLSQYVNSFKKKRTVQILRVTKGFL